MIHLIAHGEDREHVLRTKRDFSACESNVLIRVGSNRAVIGTGCYRDLHDASFKTYVYAGSAPVAADVFDQSGYLRERHFK